MRRWAVLGASSTLMLTASAGAEGNADADSSAAGTYTLDPHVITTTRLPRNIEKIPYSVDELSFDDLAARESGVSIDESLRRLPGLFVSNRQNLSQGDRLSIRGIGSRTSFGVRGVRVLLDHIPLTMPDGQSQLSNVDLASVGRVDVGGAGKPVVATPVGGVPELVVDGEMGILVPPRDPDQLAKAIIDLLHNPEVAGRMGQSGTARLRRQFSQEKMFDQVNALYQALSPSASSS